MGHLFCVDEEIWDLFAELGSDLDLGNACCLGFEQQLAFAALEEAKIGYLQPKVDLGVETRDQLVKLPHSGTINTEDGVGLLQKLPSLLFDLVVLEADLAETVLALLWGVEEGEDRVLEGVEAVVLVLFVVPEH